MALHCRVPSKLIVSGEHAVVYGQPALSMAIDLQTYCEITSHSSNNPSIRIQLPDYALDKTYHFEQAWLRAMQLEQSYQDYLAGQKSINQVCDSALDIPLLCCAFFNQKHGLKPGEWQIKLCSESWRGRGLGSSAAIIVSLLSALYQSHPKAEKDQLLGLAQKVENYQHGRSSGIDPTTLATGGLIRYQLNEPLQSLDVNLKHAWIIDTGQPDSSTGQCVDLVKKHFGQDTKLWQAFGQCTDQLQQAWLSQNTDLFFHQLEVNQHLLTQLGVVPNKVQKFIQQLTQPGLVVKLCGAGAVTGDKAGVLMAIANPGLCKDAETKLQSLCQASGYAFKKIKLVKQAIRCQSMT
ncbi:hypothetical protein JX580_02685 [Thiomicrospira microaerophila]|uniref:mevalonate kinase family protein n=1 Tax=Thiomicrospira microaerophila TaxID=406020 RepID=UPI00200C29A2|nr:hypothetical protein [Thiomicrospira microaerophila]UQB42822.1 hypothetical protein JX580_02685 [Thiomicrospira microaerophila]